MTIKELFEAIGANGNPPTNEAEIDHAEMRINGKFPKTLREWYLQADGSSGEARVLHWRFPSLNRLHTISQRFPAADIIVIESPTGQKRVASGKDYLIVCDQLIYAPYYAVNIAPKDGNYGEVIAANEEDPSNALLAAPSFEKFATYLAEHSSESFLIMRQP